MTDPFPIRPVSADEFPAFFAVGEHAFNSSWPTQPAIEYEFATWEAERSLAAFDGASMVGTTTAFTFAMAVPGGLARAAGVSFVAVLPTYRRRGILTALMRRQLAGIREQGEPVAALFASEPAIYGRYGYGCATQQLRFTIRRGEGTIARPSSEQVRIRAAEPEQARPELAKVYDSVLAGRPGMMARDDRWWTAVVADPEFARRGQSPLRAIVAEDAAGPRGYALYSAKPEWGDGGLPAGTLSISELIAADPAATAALWADLLSRDLIGEVSAGLRPVDDPLLQLLADRRRARARLSDGLWVRLTNVPAALAGRRYACEVDVVIEVADELLPANSGRWRLRAGGLADQAAASCERTTVQPAIRVPAAALGATYLGGTRLGALAAAGQVTELRPGALAALSAALSWDPAPWCPMIF
jgi:predicted acetyltransferase